MWIVKTEAYDADGEPQDRHFVQTADLEHVMNLLLQDEGRVAYSKIEIINYDK